MSRKQGSDAYVTLLQEYGSEVEPTSLEPTKMRYLNSGGPILPESHTLIIML
jgi:hypothetical protein